MESTMFIPEEITLRVPLFKSEWMFMINKIREHPHAPVWNTKCGDRLISEDMEFIKGFEEKLYARDNQSNVPGISILKWIVKQYNSSLWFNDKLLEAGVSELPDVKEIENSFINIPLMKREDLQKNLVKIVPYDEDLSRLILNPTSGTTGQPILCPNHPKAIGCYDPMIQFILKKHAVAENYNYKKVAAIQVCAQKSTITYNTVHSYLDGAGFAKINLSETEWKEDGSSEKFINDMAPVFLSGDPYSFYVYMKHNISYKPKAILTTAATLEKHFRKKMENYFCCPVINLYSLNETGPIAYSCPINPEEFHVLPTDVYLETVNADASKPGELVVTGGRNPYIPLLRYATGDFGVIDYSACSCGDSMPKIKQLSARKLVVFKTKQGKLVNQLDISRIVSKHPILFFQFKQKKDYSCELRVNFMYTVGTGAPKQILEELKLLFGKDMEIEIIRDGSIKDKKNIPFISEL